MTGWRPWLLVFGGPVCFALPVVLVMLPFVEHSRYQREFPRVAVGMTTGEVVARMGRPDVDERPPVGAREFRYSTWLIDREYVVAFVGDRVVGSRQQEKP